MSVRVAYYDGADAGLGTFMDDLVNAIDDAVSTGDLRAADRLRSFVLDYLEGSLGGKTARQLDRFLAGIGCWRETSDWNVYRIPDTPSLAFAARITTNGTIDLVAVGACRKYPAGNPDAWWNEEIAPRLWSMT